MIRRVSLSSGQTGFTLIELLVVMVIIATLLSIVAPRYFNSIDKAKEAVLRQDLSILRDSIDQFYSDTGNYPLSLEELVERSYLRSIPVDPLTESNETWIPINSPNEQEEGDMIFIPVIQAKQRMEHIIRNGKHTMFSYSYLCVSIIRI